MRKLAKFNSKFYLFLFLLIFMAFPVYAKTISRVSLTLSGDKPVAGNSVGSISCSTGSSGYYVESCDYMNNYGYWDADGSASCVIGLVAFDENEFSSNVSASVSGMNAKVSDVRVIDDTVYVTVSIPITKGSSSSSNSSSRVTWLDQVDNPYWSGTTAHWDKVDDASKYEVQLYRDNNRVTSHTTSSRSYNFSSNMSASGSYYFRVRAENGSVKGDWSDWSDEYWKDSNTSSHSSSSSSSSSSGGPGSSGGSSSSGGPSASSSPVSAIQNNYGWIQDAIGWWYKNPDGSYTRNNWQQINGKWYFFDERGYMKTGWISWNNNSYFCGPDGVMYANTFTPDGYYVDASGAWVPGIRR